ncbi:MAG: hypothetical protein KC468_31080, partial [Myxococcales bacterium]|nr:hypothetical protein [Myxococcales bacterium]
AEREPGHERARARALLGPRVPLALFAAGSFLVALCDDLTRAPYSDAWIGLLPASAERFSEVMRVDVWNPAAKAVVDGDALAFRRFSQWLRGVLPRAGLDATVTFRELDDDELED